MKKKIITEKVNASLLKGIANLGKADDDQADAIPFVLPVFQAEEKEYMVDVKKPGFFEGEALATLTVYEEKTVFMSVMFFGDCKDEKLANEEADKYHIEMGENFVWGFSEEFYPDDAMRITTSFEYTDEDTLCDEIEKRFALFGDESFIDRIKPIIKYFQ